MSKDSSPRYYQKKSNKKKTKKGFKKKKKNIRKRYQDLSEEEKFSQKMKNKG